MSKNKKPTVVDSKQEKPQLIERVKDAYFFKRNLDAMMAAGWDKDGRLELIKDSAETVVKVDPVIMMQGIKNPLVCCFVGFSTRALYDSVLKKKKVVRSSVIIEPNPGVIKHAFATEDWSDLILNKTVDFIIGRGDQTLVAKLFRSLTRQHPDGINITTTINNMEIVIDPFQDKLRGNVGQEFVSLIQTAVQQIRLSMGCSDDQFRRFELMVENMKPMFNAWKINGLYDKFSDTPVFILGGGPSLEEFIKEYNANPSLANSVIIASDAVLARLLSANIKPNIVTRCERKRTNIFKGITKEQTKGIYYAAYPWTPTEYFDLFDDVFYLFRQNGVCLFTGLSHGFVDGGVSAGNAAMELAINLGAKNIIMSGIDLCFIDNKSHVDGTQVEFDVEKSKDKWTKVPSNDGKETTTIPVWERCRNEYMQAIEKHRSKGKTFEVINTSSKGAVVPLTTTKTFDQIRDLFNHSSEKPDVLIERYREKLSSKEIEAFKKKLKDTVKKTKELSEMCEIAVGLGEDARRTAEREIDKIWLQISTSIEKPYERIRALRQNQPNLTKLWSAVSDSYDMNFKQRMYNDMTFRILIFDVLQLNMFQYENSCSGLINTVESVDERCFLYYAHSKDFVTLCKHYLDLFTGLFNKAVSNI